MEQAIKFVELSNAFVTELLKNSKSVERIEGRRFDRFKCDDTVRFFVDRNSWEVYGAKSSFQYNPRRWYGTLDSLSQYSWTDTPTPIAGTPAERIFNERESEITKNYKPRGRPRKTPIPATTK
jgi:hypothetical protein